MNPDLLTESFGRAVRARRAEVGVTQAELGEKAGLDRTYVSGVERGIRNPSLKIIGQIADALNTPLSTLLEVAQRIAEE